MLDALFGSTAGPALLGSIPSPSSGQLQLGPFRLTAYGLMIALGVVAAVEISRHRHAARGRDPDDFSQIAVWGVIAGLIGARLYHVLTDLDRFRGRWGDVVKVWEGGLGIPGGLLLGVGVGLWAAKRRGISAGYGLDIVAPAIPVAQAIGRVGNWWNQELFGGPTDLPWGLRIDAAHRPAGYEDVGTYHPAFLYEALWNLALAGLVVWLGRRTAGKWRPGSMFAVYVAGYGIGRFWIEALRIDPAQRLFGIRFNLLVAAAATVIALGWLLLRGRRNPATVGLDALSDTEQLDVRDWAGASGGPIEGADDDDREGGDVDDRDVDDDERGVDADDRPARVRTRPTDL